MGKDALLWVLFSEESSQILYLMYHIRHIRLGCISNVALHHITEVMCCDRLAMQCVSWKMGKDVISWAKCSLSFMVFSSLLTKQVAGVEVSPNRFNCMVKNSGRFLCFLPLRWLLTGLKLKAFFAIYTSIPRLWYICFPKLTANWKISFWEECSCHLYCSVQDLGFYFSLARASCGARWGVSSAPVRLRTSPETQNVAATHVHPEVQGEGDFPMHDLFMVHSFYKDSPAVTLLCLPWWWPSPQGWQQGNTATSHPSGLCRKNLLWPRYFSSPEYRWLGFPRGEDRAVVTVVTWCVPSQPHQTHCAHLHLLFSWVSSQIYLLAVGYLWQKSWLWLRTEQRSWN